MALGLLAITSPAGYIVDIQLQGWKTKTFARLKEKKLNVAE
jgi:hypothetical protein